MKSIAIILSLAFSVGLYICIRFEVKRMRHMGSLKRFAKEHGYSLTKKGNCVVLNTPPIDETNSGRRKQIEFWDVADGEIPVLLLSPANAPVRLSQTQGTSLKRLHAGDKIGNVLFADLDFLLRHIEKNET